MGYESTRYTKVITTKFQAPDLGEYLCEKMEERPYSSIENYLLTEETYKDYIIFNYDNGYPQGIDELLECNILQHFQCRTLTYFYNDCYDISILINGIEQAIYYPYGEEPKLEILDNDGKVTNTYYFDKVFADNKELEKIILDGLITDSNFQLENAILSFFNVNK